MSEEKYRGGEPIHPVNSRSVPANLHIVDLVSKPAWLHNWERLRPIWLLECMAEATGAFMYTYAGVGATAAFIVGGFAKEEGIGALLNIGLAYGLGIVFAITVCGMTSGGHFSPSVTIAFALFRGFSWRKVPGYILSQIFGAFLACLIVYGQYRQQILEIEESLMAAKLESVIFSPQGTAGIFAIYPNAGQNLGNVLMNEFFVCFFLGLVIWGVIDPSNIFVTPSSIPFVVGLAYTALIWGYVPVTLAANAARDLGGRFAVLAIWGTSSWPGRYAAISALTNIPATILAALFYELFLADSSRVVVKAAREVVANADAHREHKAYKYNLEINRRRTPEDSAEVAHNEHVKPMA
ncbi:hypothetical protein BOTBODRAFT_67910 [Botryobasidium botryosum FD-172 SS1]|uniref:Aquaporin n=1 Tax=Botryobasidium botryosum (strain FD-172 SS1) TaxID=930990 RepID=A0A067M7K5_BOTB1|nr:hypothetical protein BOTBODRAFT_67910 [Botryobasidium botryosum FD-172 SS1]